MTPIEPAGYFDSGMTPFYYQADIDKLQREINALNLAFKANKEMLAAETARADAEDRRLQEAARLLEEAEGKVEILEQQCEELLSVLCAVAPHSDRLPLYLGTAINMAIASAKGGA